MVGQGPPKTNSSVKAVRVPAKVIRINFFRILEMNQRLAIIQGTFIQKKA
jgi:hypothetical protein